MNRQRLILAVLVVLLALAIGYALLRSPKQRKAEKLTFSPGAVATGPKTGVTVGQETRVRLDLLQKNQVAFTGFKRNIFTPLFRDMSKLPPAKPVLPAPPPAPPPPAPPPSAMVPNTVEQDMARFTFLGFLEKDRKKTIFLSQGKDIFLVKKGERLAGKYEAVAITDEALTIRPLGSEGNEIIIPLFENQALKVSPQRSGKLPMPRPVTGGVPVAPSGAPPGMPPGVPVPPGAPRGTVPDGTE
jgi:hypothetical protein